LAVIFFEMAGPIITAIIFAVVFIVFVISAIVKGQRRKLSAGIEEMIGKIAKTHTMINPAGTVFAEGELWNATTEDKMIEANTEVIITGIQGLTLQVTKKIQKEEKR